MNIPCEAQLLDGGLPHPVSRGQSALCPLVMKIGSQTENNTPSPQWESKYRTWQPLRVTTKQITAWVGGWIGGITGRWRGTWVDGWVDGHLGFGGKEPSIPGQWKEKRTRRRGHWAWRAAQRRWA